MPWRKTLCKHLPKAIAARLMALSSLEAAKLTEIRVRAGCPVRWIFTDGMCREKEITSAEEIDELINALCGYSRYAFESQMAQGYIALPDGHRAGICGHVIYEDGEVARISAIRSVCIRIARAIEGISIPMREFLFVDEVPASVLLLGPPGCGKTTMLRDAAEYLVKECCLQLAAADEREEFFGRKNELEIDVLCGAKKADAFRLLTRTMSPQVIVADEIGHEEDAYAILDAAACGIAVLVSAHAGSMEDVFRRPALRMLFERRAIDRYILLGSCARIRGVWNAQGKQLLEEDNEQQGSRSNGDDRDQRCRIAYGRW